MNFSTSKFWQQLFGNLLIALLLTVPSLSKANLPEGVAVSISAVKSDFSALEPILIKVRYTNTSDQLVTFLKWDTALEGRISSDFLSVNGGTSTLPFAGRHYKRAAPSLHDYVSIEPGDYLEATVDVLEAYALNMRGEYSIEYRTPANLEATKRLNSHISLNLMQDRPVRIFRQPPSFQNCVGSRPSIIDSAVAAAESIARRARDDLQNTPIGSRTSADRYRVWFGAYEVGRWNTVQDHFNRIYSAASGRVLNFICDDSDPAYAYVYPTQPYNIYLGRAFWPAPATGTDSKAGTIVHELSHFTVLGDTDDVVYGQSGARSLAISNPNSAVRNADSHEYFAENTPALSMPRPGRPEPPQPEPEPEPPAPPPPPLPPIIIQILNMLLLEESESD